MDNTAQVMCLPYLWLHVLYLEGSRWVDEQFPYSDIGLLALSTAFRNGQRMIFLLPYFHPYLISVIV